MDDVGVQVVPLHNSSTEEGVSKLFSSAWVNYEASVIVTYVRERWRTLVEGYFLQWKDAD